jgi:tRNA(fMet)-specific endonuclease VapC
LAPHNGGLSAADLAFSGDGRWQAWIAFPEGTLWRARADGSERQQLTTPPLRAYLPRFSPDGQRIVFLGRNPDESGNSVRVVLASGGEPELLAPPSSQVTNWWDACWLPDGQTVVSSALETARLVSTAEAVFLPFVVVAELRTGFAFGKRTAENERVLRRFLLKEGVAVLYADDQTTHHYAAAYRQLRHRGTPIPTNDLWIAALVLQHNLRLHDRDRHFNHLPQIVRV